MGEPCPRHFLRISATSRGEVAGHVQLRLADGQTLELITNIHQIPGNVDDVEAYKHAYKYTSEAICIIVF